jgi:hypothetical protein
MGAGKKPLGSLSCLGTEWPGEGQVRADWPYMSPWGQARARVGGVAPQNGRGRKWGAEVILIWTQPRSVG